jgi:hypothetical protein
MRDTEYERKPRLWLQEGDKQQVYEIDHHVFYSWPYDRHLNVATLSCAINRISTGIEQNDQIRLYPTCSIDYLYCDEHNHDFLMGPSYYGSISSIGVTFDTHRETLCAEVLEHERDSIIQTCLFPLVPMHGIPQLVLAFLLLHPIKPYPTRSFVQN